MLKFRNQNNILSKYFWNIFINHEISRKLSFFQQRFLLRKLSLYTKIYCLVHSNNLGFKFVIFKGDAKFVIDSIICSSSDPPWEISSIISDIHNLFPYFSIAKFSFCYQSWNDLAHHLVHWTCISSNWGP